MWPTVIGGQHPEGALFYASSRDGRTFTPRARIPTLGSIKPTHPQIALTNTGQTVVAWDEVINGQRVAAAREMKVLSGQRVDFGPVVNISSEGNALYPALTATSSGLLAVWMTGDQPSSVRARRLRIP